MAVIKVSEFAKKAEISVEEAVSKFKEAGINVSSGEDNIREEDLAALSGDRHQQLDRRQEMLKKALERHKRGVKIKEVFVNKGGPQDQLQTRKMSKEDLMKKRTELDMRLKKVDEDRETIIKERSAAPESIANIAPTEEKQQEPIAVEEKQQPVQVSAPIDEPTPPQLNIEPEQEKAIPKPTPENSIQLQQPPQTTTRRPQQENREARPRTPQQNTTARPQGERQPYQGNRPEGQRTYTPRPQTDAPRPTTAPRNDGTSFARPYTPRPQTDGTNFARPYTPRLPGQPDPRQNADRQYTRDSRDSRDSRPSGDRPYQPRTGQSGDKPYGQRPQYDRGGERGGERGAGGNRPGQGMGTPRFSGETGLALTAEEERKRLAKKKEDDAAKEKDSKKPKAKKDLKKPKSWVKTINEGIDELNIEREVEHKTISPNIDISDLVNLDNDKKRFRSGSFNKSGFDKRSKRRNDSNKAGQKVFLRPDAIEIGERVIIADFGSMIGIKATELIKKLFAMDIMATVNQSIDAETAQLLGLDYGVDVVMKIITEDDLLAVSEDDEADLTKRPPIVTVMGHVDHGKTSLLDAIRSTSVAAGEAGGITQHIGAYEVEMPSGKIIFLDTPGHEAFTTLRARGALLTDIVILVVAADDGVKPQTKEAIDHAKAAGVRIVVAINKIDKEGANPDNVRRQLADYGIIGDDWGGEHQFQEISAKKRIGIDDLLERVLLEAEVLDLKGNPNREANGIVIESRLDKQKGPVATVLVKNGTLKKGDTFVSGSQYGKVRAMFNFKGMAMKDAGVSIPVEVMGFSEVPDAGEKFIVTDEKTARQVAELRMKSVKEKQQADRGKLTLADLFGKIKDGELKELNIILKADAQGSLEALSASLLKLSNQEVKVNIIHDGMGAITESDVALAAASHAIIIGFNVRPDNNARSAAEREQVDIELYSVIYKAIDDVKLALEGLLSPEVKENIVGRVEVRQVFSVPKIGKIAGCFVLEGKVTRNALVRIVRDSIVVFDGKITSLKRFTEDTREVAAGYECGLSIDKFQDIKEKDILEVYEMTEEKRTLEDVAKQEELDKNANK